MTNILLILLAIFLVILNGFFVAAEFSLVKLRQTQVKAIQDSYGMRGRILGKVHSQLDAYLSACQLGITLASLGLGWVGEPAFARLLEPLLHELDIFSPTAISAIAFVTAFFIISFLHIVAGELAPKSAAIRQSKTVSLWTALPLYCFYWLMYPFIWLLNISANYVLKLFGTRADHESETNYTADELKLILDANQLQGDLEKEELQMLDNVLDFADLKVADIMRPVDELIALNLNHPVQENLQLIAQNHFSRYPVYTTQPEQAIGILHVKDIFVAMLNDKPIVNLQELIRPILSVNIDLPALDLFKQFREGLTHFTVVTNHNGIVVGFVTLDNILNELLGQIQDEFIKNNLDLAVAKDGALLIKGNSPIYLLEKALHIEIKEQEANTISGLIMTKLERMPEMNERIAFNEFTLKVIKIKGPRILLVKVYSDK
jgi:CBS domain containing-hemolysin-like protein